MIGLVALLGGLVALTGKPDADGEMPAGKLGAIGMMLVVVFLVIFVPIELYRFVKNELGKRSKRRGFPVEPRSSRLEK